MVEVKTDWYSFCSENILRNYWEQRVVLEDVYTVVNKIWFDTTVQ